MHDRAGDALEHSFIGKLERVNDLEKCRHILQARRTDFAGASTNIAPENPIYAATVGATARFQREYNGKQPGDPARAAAALMQIAGLEAPPLRLPLGSDAARAVEEAELARIASDKRWKELSMSTDFPPNA